MRTSTTYLVGVKLCSFQADPASLDFHTQITIAMDVVAEYLLYPLSVSDCILNVLAPGIIQTRIRYIRGRKFKSTLLQYQTHVSTFLLPHLDLTLQQFKGDLGLVRQQACRWKSVLRNYMIYHSYVSRKETGVDFHWS
jgi:hypothetical protein